MNINRNNCEEYFLLYADKELSAEQKNMVEVFVQQNPDLEEEFVMLQQSVVKPDKNISLENKSSLLREEALQQDQYINQTNYEEKFLLYTDGELSSSEIEETEKFVLANPALQHEFNLLQQVTYEPDTSIVFPDKSLLYKKEVDNKVVPFPRTYLAAAILLGIGLWTGVSYLQKNTSIKPETAVKQTAPKGSAPVKISEPKKDEANPLVKYDGKEIAPANKKSQDNLNIQKQPQQNITVKNIQPVDKKDDAPKSIDKKEDVIAGTETPDKIEVPKPTNDLPKPINTTSEINNKTAVASVPKNINSYAQPASYIEEAEVKSDNYVFYNITAEEFRKSKVGNFLKKVKRVIAGKLPLKNNSLKIGTVEIAKDDQN